MSRLIIDTGTLGNPATGDTLRTAMGKINDNFLEVYDDLAGAGLGGQLTNTTTNGNVIIQPNGTGIVEVDQLQINGDNITSLITNGDLTLSGNGTGGVEVLGSFSAGSVVTNTIVSNGSNATLNIDGSGTGKVIIDAAEVEIHHDGTKVLDTSTGLIDITGSLFLTAATPTIFLKRSDNANQPAITFKSSGGTDSANILMDGTSGTTNELIFQTFADSSLSEKFRVTTGGAKVTGTLNIDDGITITDNTITTSASNANLELTAASSGTVKVIGNLTLDDSDEIKLGTSGDLRIFHNGSHSIVREDGTGSLYLQSDNNVILSKDTSTEIMVKGIADGAVELYHDNTKKFETTAGGVSVVGAVTSTGATDLTLNTNAGTDSGSIVITDAANGDITVETNGTGDILLKAGGQVGIGTVSSPDTDLHIKKPNAVITLQRTADANQPGIDFQQSGGNVRAELRMDGTSGTSNEVFVKTHDGSSLAERFRVGHTKTSVAGHLEVSGAQVDFTALPTSDPGVAGRLFRSGNDVKISTG